MYNYRKHGTNEPTVALKTEIACVIVVMVQDATFAYKNMYLLHDIKGIKSRVSVIQKRLMAL